MKPATLDPVEPVAKAELAGFAEGSLASTGELGETRSLSVQPKGHENDFVSENLRNRQRWAVSPIQTRLDWVRRFRSLLAANVGPLSKSICREVHKPEDEALTADVAPLLAACRWHERRARRVLGAVRAPGTPLWLRYLGVNLTRAPLGRVGIIATWNYPVQLLGIQMLQALVAGNSVVVKPSEHAPETQGLLMDIAERAGLPAGILSRRDATRDEGRRMILEDDLDHLVFTGSTRTGREIAKAAAERLLPTTLELSGNDSAIVLVDADPELAARSIWFGVTANGGQTCMAPRRVLVHLGIYDRFLAAIAPLAASAKPRRLINSASAERCFRLCIEAVGMGGRSLSGVLEAPKDGWIRPMVIVDCPPGAALVEGDHFGPALAVVAVSNLDEAIAIHHREELPGEAQHLSCAVYGRSGSVNTNLAVRLGASFVTINDSLIPQSHPATSIAGRGPSGWGASRGVEGLLAMTRPVAVSRSGLLMRPPSEPPTPSQAARLGRAIAWLYR